MLNLGGADMDIDLVTHKFSDAVCPWTKVDGRSHKCACKGVSICAYFRGRKAPDTIVCSYDDDMKQGGN